MEARNIPPCGKQVVVQDLVVLSDWLHKSVSVTGRLDEHDVNNCCARLVAPKTRYAITVDTTLVEPFDARIGSVFQFIGEVKPASGNESNETTAMLQARVVRNCEGLDLLMYEHVLKTQKEYLESRRRGK